MPGARRRDEFRAWLGTLYRWCTADTIVGAILVLFGLLMLLTLFGSGSSGVINGASAAIDGDPLEGDVEAVADVETEVWTEMREMSPLGRSIYGLMHWFVVTIVWTTIGGMHLGYAAPILGRVVAWTAEPVLYLIFVVACLQLVRVLQVVIWGNSRPGPTPDWSDAS